MDYATIGGVYGKNYAVFPYGIYAAETTLPAPYYAYEPRGPGTFLVPPGTNVNPYGPTAKFGWKYFKNGYGEGNLIGHTCECECASMPSGYGPNTQTSSLCWCGKGNSGLCKGCKAVNIQNIKLR